MSLSETYISRKQLIADNLNSMGESTADVTDGLTTLAGKILDIPNKQSTTLTISVPLNLEYGDDFNITGILTSAGNGISNATIKLKVGNAVVDTDTTDSEGEVSFTQCPVRTGNHSFQLIFEGDINYASSESTVVTRDVEKETSVITLDYPIASNHYSDEDIVVSGVLTDNDDTPIANKDITLKDGNAQLLIVTTESDGSFSDTINLNTGSHILNVIYEGDENYTASSVSRNVTIVAPSLSLSSDKDILSYNGGVNPDSATLTATLNAYDNVGKTVTFEVRKQSDDSLVETLTGDTNSSGIATVSYLGKGVGDLNIKAECMLFIQTYSIIDAWNYIPNPVEQSGLSLNLPSSASISFKIKKTSTSNRGGIYLNFIDSSHTYFVGNWSSTLDNGLLIRNTGSSSNLVAQTCSDAVLNKEQVIEVTYKNGTWTYAIDEEVKTVSANYIPTALSNIEIRQGTMTDLIIKPL